MAFEMKHEKTDAGRSAEGFGYERLDCTVNAVAMSFDISYAEAHRILEKAGRKDRHKMGLVLWNRFLAQEQVDGYRLTRDEGYDRMTLALAVSKMPAGRYLIKVRNHALAIVDGVVYENAVKPHPLRRVQRVFRITKEGDNGNS